MSKQEGPHVAPFLLFVIKSIESSWVKKKSGPKQGGNERKENILNIHALKKKYKFQSNLRLL